MASHESSDRYNYIHIISPTLNIVKDQSESTTSLGSQESSKELSSLTPESPSSSTIHNTFSVVSQREPIMTSSPVPENQRDCFPDNIDKTVKPRHQTSDGQNKSLRYIQVFGVLTIDAWMKDDNERKQLLMDVASHTIEQNVDFSTSFCDSTSELPSAFYIHTHAKL